MGYKKNETFKVYIKLGNSENSEWLKQTRYLQIKPDNEFRDRSILAEPDKFCDKEKSD